MGNVDVLLLGGILASISPQSVETSSWVHRQIIEKERIINGIPVDRDAYPFVVSVTLFDSITSQHDLVGTGSIVAADKILTACQTVGRVVEGEVVFHMPHWVTVSAGTLKLDDSDSSTKQQTVGQRIIPHPSCKIFFTNDTQFDCASIVLKIPFKINDHVKPVPWISFSKIELIAQLNEITLRGYTCSVPGWGTTLDEEYKPSIRLLDTQVRLVPTNMCKIAFCRVDPESCSNRTFENNALVCTMPYLSAPCRGDQGSPLVCDGYMYAMMSWSAGCRPSYPSLFVHPTVLLYMINYKPEGTKIAKIRKAEAVLVKPFKLLGITAIIQLGVLHNIHLQPYRMFI